MNIGVIVGLSSIVIGLLFLVFKGGRILFIGNEDSYSEFSNLFNNKKISYTLIFKEIGNEEYSSLIENSKDYEEINYHIAKYELKHGHIDPVVVMKIEREIRLTAIIRDYEKK